MKVCIKDGHFPFSWHNTVTYRTQLNTRITVYVKTCSNLNVFSFFVLGSFFVVVDFFLAIKLFFQAYIKMGDRVSNH